MDNRKLELKAELSRRGMKYRDLAAHLKDRGFDIGEYGLARIVAGRWDPPRDVRQAIADILGRPTFELF